MENFLNEVHKMLEDHMKQSKVSEKIMMEKPIEGHVRLDNHFKGMISNMDAFNQCIDMLSIHLVIAELDNDENEKFKVLRELAFSATEIIFALRMNIIDAYEEIKSNEIDKYDMKKELNNLDSIQKCNILILLQYKKILSEFQKNSKGEQNANV